MRRYCADCGQRATELRPTLRELLHEALHELSHVDGKLIRTVRLLLTQPGALTKEFLEGKRARSVSPVRIYLLCSVVFFGIVSMLPTSNLHVSVSRGDAQIQRAAEKINRDPAILAHALTTAFPKAMFLLMPLFGLIVYAFYHRTERLYVPHLYFAVHYHAFAFLVLSLFEATRAIHARWAAIARLLILLATIPYLTIALRRVYGGNRAIASLKTAGIMTIYATLIVLTMAAIAYITMRRLG